MRTQEELIREFGQKNYIKLNQEETAAGLYKIFNPKEHYFFWNEKEDIVEITRSKNWSDPLLEQQMDDKVIDLL